MPRPKTRKRKAHRRRSFVFDPDTEKDVSYIQQNLRATTASEAMRYAVRKMAELIRAVNDDATLQLVSDLKRVEVDLPKS